MSSHFQIGIQFSHKREPLPYMVSQPLPWQVHSVSHSRRSSRAEEVSGNNTGSPVQLGSLYFHSKTLDFIQPLDFICTCPIIYCHERWN